MKMAQVTKPKTFPCSLPLSRLNPLCLALRHQLQHLRLHHLLIQFLPQLDQPLNRKHHHCLFPQEQRVLETSRMICPRVNHQSNYFLFIVEYKVTIILKNQHRGQLKLKILFTTSLTSKTSATPETSPTFPTLEEESSVEQTTKMSSKYTTVSTSSTLFSTEKSSILSIREQSSATTAQTEKSSVSAITDKTEQSAMVTKADEDGSGDQTSEMYTDISSVINFTKLPSFTGEPSISPSSDETLTSSMTMSPSWASVISSVKEMDDDSISSISTMVESIPSFSGPTMGPGTAFLAPQLTTQAEKSVDSSVDLTAESLLLATTLSSMLNTEIPSVTVTSQTERLSATPETSSTISKTDEDGSDISMQSSSVTSKSSLFSTEAPTATSPVTSSADSVLTSIGSTLKPETSSLLIPTGTEGSGDITDDFAQESTIRATTFSSLSSTKSPSVTASHETETSDTLKTAITRASSLYSTEKPHRGQLKLKILTEKSSILSIREQASATTAQTKKSSVSAITDKTEQSAMVTKADEDGSGDQTSEMYTDISSVINFTKLPSFTGEPSISPSSDETLTSSMTMSPSWASVISSVKEMDDDSISSISTMWTNHGPWNCILGTSTYHQAEKSVDSSVDLTAESLLLATTLSSMLNTEIPSVTVTSQTERLSATPETSSTISKTDEDGSGDQTQDISMQSSLSRLNPLCLALRHQLQHLRSYLNWINPKPETSSLLIPTGTEGSGDITDDFAQESTIRATTFSSLSSTKSPSVTASHETETSDTLKTAITRASSLYSTEKPTSGSAKTQDTVTTSLTRKTSATPETSSTFPTLEEESSVEQTTKCPANTLRTEKSSILSIREQASATTAQTEKSSVSAITDKTEQSAMVTKADEDGSGDQTSEMYTDISSVINFTKLPSFTGEHPFLHPLMRHSQAQ
ncbi:hypothetical protein F7725_012711 [Dissostichus mawsoni]|uniref:Uncharacterized protein n=1 Tax=Dissostichus mawsoni TaxID=36200 RepID=A0A7J5YQC6_DISMA|nr:hypothetical protein F7725_012711 [Dissostichus mawsoni]